MTTCSKVKKYPRGFAIVFFFALFILPRHNGAASSPENAAQGDDFRMISPALTAWLKQNAFPFLTSDPNQKLDDLMFLKTIVGKARIVSLGEATHGTREFFEMKHRILRFLVEEMGFNIFAIEATWPESNLVNDYVHTGVGDPARLLAGLYFWTWNTQEVLNMILWMRQHNLNPGNASKVSFFGFDMQYPKMAMDNVVIYLNKIDPSAAAAAESLYSPYRAYQSSPSSYRNAPSDVKALCQKNVQQVYDMLADNRERYVGLSGKKDFEFALQSARIVIQNECLNSGREADARDRAMAENATWLLEQGGPEAKIVLWAHNGHVQTQAGYQTMGKVLRERYGEEMVVSGFSFCRGQFNAVSYNFQTGQYGFLKSHQAPAPPADSYEYIFLTVGMPRFFLDLRGISFDSESTAWLKGPRYFRSIGSVYDDSSPLRFFYPSQLPKEFDVIIYIQDTTASFLLPFYK